MSETTIVIATRDRADELGRTLERLAGLDPPCPVIVVDNASTDGTASMVESHRSRFPRGQLELVRLAGNAGAVARNEGIRRARTPYIAFCDDDSWWAPGAIAQGEEILRASPRVGLLACRVLVGAEAAEDPTNELMARSPLPRRPGIPGPEVLGFLACAAIARTEVLRECGGFSSVLGFGGEERLLAYAIAARGWSLCYAEDIIVHHHPSPARLPARQREALEKRNAVLAALLARPPGVALRAVAGLARDVLARPALVPALAGVAQRLPRALRDRDPVPPVVEDNIRMLEEAGMHG